MSCGCEKNCKTVITRKGEKGDTGLTGATGPTGPTGTFDLTTISYAETVDLVVANGDNKMFTNIPIVTTGTYLVLFQADVDNNGSANNFEFDYSIMKNDIFTPIGDVSTCFVKNDGVISRISSFDFVVLTALDELNVKADVTSFTAGQVIGKRSVKLLKIA